MKRSHLSFERNTSLANIDGGRYRDKFDEVYVIVSEVKMCSSEADEEGCADTSSPTTVALQFGEYKN